MSGQPDSAMSSDVVDALAASQIEAPPAGLRSRVLSAALGQRRAGRPPGYVAITPVEGYRRTVAELDGLLEELAADEWRAPVELYGWSVQGLLGHLLAIERAIGARLGTDDQLDVPPEVAHDHIAMTVETVAAQEGREPSRTLEDWRLATRRVLEALSAGVDGAGRVELYGIPWRWDTLLVARTLEVWTHTDDIRRATGRPLAAPDAQRLGLMTELAVRTIPQLVAATEPSPGSEPGSEPARSVRFVLTGPGGGAWTRPLGPVAPLAGPEAQGAGPPAVRIVADAVSFCRLTAGRLTADELEPRVEGDGDLADRLLSLAATFAA